MTEIFERRGDLPTLLSFAADNQELDNLPIVGLVDGSMSARRSGCPGQTVWLTETEIAPASRPMTAGLLERARLISWMGRNLLEANAQADTALVTSSTRLLQSDLSPWAPPRLISREFRRSLSDSST